MQKQTQQICTGITKRHSKNMSKKLCKVNQRVMKKKRDLIAMMKNQRRRSQRKKRKSMRKKNPNITNNKNKLLSLLLLLLKSLLRIWSASTLNLLNKKILSMDLPISKTPILLLISINNSLCSSNITMMVFLNFKEHNTTNNSKCNFSNSSKFLNNQQDWTFRICIQCTIRILKFLNLTTSTQHWTQWVPFSSQSSTRKQQCTNNNNNNHTTTPWWTTSILSSTNSSNKDHLNNNSINNNLNCNNRIIFSQGWTWTNNQITNGIVNQWTIWTSSDLPNNNSSLILLTLAHNKTLDSSNRILNQLAIYMED